LPVEPNLSSGSLKGFKKRIFEVNAELFETQGGRGRVRRNRHGDLGALDRVGGCADHHDGQAARLGRRAQSDRCVRRQGIKVEYGGFERQVLKRRLGRADVAGGDGGPAKRVQAGGERPDTGVMSRQDQNARVESQASPSPLVAGAIAACEADHHSATHFIKDYRLRRPPSKAGASTGLFPVPESFKFRGLL